MLNINKIWFWTHNCNLANEMFVASATNFIFRIHGDETEREFLDWMQISLGPSCGHSVFQHVSKLQWRHYLGRMLWYTNLCWPETGDLGYWYVSGPDTAQIRPTRESVSRAYNPAVRQIWDRVILCYAFFLQCAFGLHVHRHPIEMYGCWLGWQIICSCAEAWKGTPTFYA